MAEVFDFPGYMQQEAQKIGMDVITNTLHDKAYHHAKVRRN